MCQNNRRQYIPENWPVDGIKKSDPIEITNKRFRLPKITTKVTASHYFGGCFKAEQMAQLAKKCWM